MVFRRVLRMMNIGPKLAAREVAASESDIEQARWPLSFRIQPPQRAKASSDAAAQEKPKTRWWSHLLYRGPNNERVKILYSKTKADSEVLAQQFLKEEVVGFDMEWPWDDWKQPNKLQNKIGLIQVATEDKIALFHIGLHTGVTTNDIVAPSLRKLIESPTIGKIGVGILNADFARLSKYFKLQPKAAVELSHLHRLVTFGGRKPELVSTKMTSLANQVQQHLEHPLYKGNVRTSNWSKPLSQEQIKYAAGDAYAGIMLYHCLNYKRLQMKPTPPLPVHADKYLSYKLAGVGSLYLEPLEVGGKMMTSAFFFGVPTAVEDLSRAKKTASASKPGSKSVDRVKLNTPSNGTNGGTQAVVGPATAKSISRAPLDPVSQALYEELSRWREGVAAETKLPVYRIASDPMLSRLAEERPLDRQSLLKIRGLGVQREKLYGKGMVGVISRFVAERGVSVPEGGASLDSTTTNTPGVSSRRGRSAQHENPDSSPAFGTPPRTQQLHTGLSFTLADTKLAEADSDDSLPSLDFGTESRRTLGQKRKHVESVASEEAQRTGLGLEELFDSPSISKRISQMPLHEARSTTRPPPPPRILQPLTPRSRILGNKLLAFSRLVASRTSAPGAIVSAATLDAIARNPPQTHEELRGVEGVERLLAACVDARMDLLGKIQKFASQELGSEPHKQQRRRG